MVKQISPKTPLVNIVMAIYNPQMDWLKEQLISLNNQTYKNIKIIITDDCSDTVSFKSIQESIIKNITKFPCVIQQNTKNLGSNKTFEKLTEEAEGEYIAYCDQDDIWLPEKIEKLVNYIEETKCQLVCSDVYVIDAKGIIKANSITEVRKRHIFKSGENLASDLLFRNFVIGCTMLMKTQIAKDALPFIEDMVHDHYLALFASTRGSVGVFKENLIKYRIHGSNQTNVLSNVSTKEEYYEVRIKAYINRMNWIRKRINIPMAKEACMWADARQAYYFKEKSSAQSMWKYRELNITTTIFELVMFRMPELFFRWILKLIQNGKI